MRSATSPPWLDLVRTRRCVQWNSASVWQSAVSIAANCNRTAALSTQWRDNTRQRSSPGSTNRTSFAPLCLASFLLWLPRRSSRVWCARSFLEKERVCVYALARSDINIAAHPECKGSPYRLCRTKHRQANRRFDTSARVPPLVRSSCVCVWPLGVSVPGQMC